ncbi:uncharacterized protein A4U43_C10F8640 [Asparagus officinalis]|uniref:Uncharacterized protein n=1 Tax=Asparagus officinalis TaxID=4686 RepID=A0A5P1E391_ASPOF|nr:uncharacterized protein A4U43_C10F8640 [Asparagus officinalis]
MDLEASDDEVQIWSSSIRIPQVLKLHPENRYAANGIGAILAEKCHFNVSNDIFLEVQEAASGSIFVQMPDVWVNLGNVYFAQGHFALARK